MIRPPVLLVVDDEPGMPGLIQRFAGPAGFDVHTNASARDAIATIVERAPDVAIVDRNAVTYSRLRDPAQIAIGGAGEEDERVILFVRDDGAGFGAVNEGATFYFTRATNGSHHGHETIR